MNCVAPSITKNPSSELRALVRDLLAGESPNFLPCDWAKVTQLASDHGVSGFLFKRLHPETAKIGFSQEILAHMKHDYQSNQARYFQHLSFGLPIFKAFTAQEIPFFIYKGLSLIERYYQDPGLRPMVDVDVVVHSKDIPAVSQIIEDSGFTKSGGFGHHFYRGELCFDVHTDFFRLDRVPSRTFALTHHWEGVWDRLVVCQVQGIPVATLHPFDEFVLLSWHALKHSFSHLKWLVDLALIYQSLAKSEDFIKYLTCLPDDSVRKGVWYALRLLREWFAIPVAQSLMESVEPANTGWLESQAFKKVQAGGIWKSFAELSFLGTMTGMRPKMKFAREMLFCEGFDVRRIFSAGWSPIRQAWSRMD